jgi:hypothetical protein
MDDFGIGRDEIPSGGFTVHAIGCVFAQLGELGFEPVEAMWACNACAARVFGASGHSDSIGASDEVHIMVWAVHDLVNRVSVWTVVFRDM